MIEVRIHTNRDVGRIVEWPDKMICRPQIGDYVRALDGRCELRVVRVTHVTGLSITGSPAPYASPYLLVEVNQ